MAEGSLEAETSNNMDRWKSAARKKLGLGENQRGEDAGAEKGRTVARHCVFPMICGSGMS